MAKKISIKGVDNRLIKTCPVCGYSFRPIDPKSKKKIKACPMCGYKFLEPESFKRGKNDSNQRFI